MIQTIIEIDTRNQIVLKPAHEIIGELVLNAEERQKYQKLYEERVKEVKQKQVFINKSAS